jgi:hypothetical protein
MMENVIVGVIVGVVLLLAGRSFYRTLTGKSDGCACGTKSCPASDRCGHPAAPKKDTDIRDNP